MSPRRRTLAHPWLAVAGALVVLVLSWLVALRRPIPGWEVDTTRWLNDAPAWVAHTMWPVMQMGTLVLVLVIALVIGLTRRDWLLAACLLGGVAITWTGARIVKHVVERGRPPAYLSDLAVRDGSGGFGYLSGHSANAAAAAVILMAAVPRRWRPVLALLAAVVGIARIVHGVHFPADVVGGWAFGVIVGVAALAVYDHLAARRSREISP